MGHLNVYLDVTKEKILTVSGNRAVNIELPTNLQKAK